MFVDFRSRNAPHACLVAAIVALVAAFRGGAQDPFDLKPPAPVAQLEPAAVDVEGFSCAECHASIVAEWADTAHAVAWVDREYQERVQKRRRPPLCYACHISEPLLLGDEIARPKTREESRHHGVSCVTCHLGAGGAMLGPHGTETDAHPTRRHSAFVGQGSNELCAACHSTSIGPVVGIAKDFFAAGMTERGRSCVGCHTAPLASAEGQSGGATPVETSARPTRSHALQTPRDPAFLRLAFEPSLRVDGGKSTVVIENRAGHRVPGLIGREIRFDATLLGGDGKELAKGELVLDARHYLPVDGSLAIELGVVGERVRLVGRHVDPRHPTPIPFLDLELAQER